MSGSATASTTALPLAEDGPNVRANRPQSAPQKRYPQTPADTHLGSGAHRQAPTSSPMHRLPPRLPPQDARPALLVGRAAGSINRVVGHLRDELDSKGSGGKDVGTKAAWLSNLSASVDALRTLQLRVQPASELAEFESNAWAAECLDRRVSEVLAAAQRQCDSLQERLSAKEAALADARTRADASESKCVTATKLLSETQKREHLRRLELRAARDNQRYAEARHGACEVELQQVKAELDDLTRRSSLAFYLKVPSTKDGSALDLGATRHGQGARPSGHPDALAAWALDAAPDRVLAAAVRHHLLERGYGADASRDPDVALAFLKGLETREDVAKLVCTPAVADAMVSITWGAVEALQRRG